MRVFLLCHINRLLLLTSCLTVPIIFPFPTVFKFGKHFYKLPKIKVPRKTVTYEVRCPLKTLHMILLQLCFKNSTHRSFRDLNVLRIILLHQSWKIYNFLVNLLHHVCAQMYERNFVIPIIFGNDVSVWRVFTVFIEYLTRRIMRHLGWTNSRKYYSHCLAFYLTSMKFKFEI